MPLALGLVETNGLIAAIEAADAMAKASAVKLIGKEKTNPALVTIKVVGEVAAVKASVEAGAAAAARVGIVVSTHIIARPDTQLAALYPEILDEPVDSITTDALPEVKDSIEEAVVEPQAAEAEIIEVPITEVIPQVVEEEIPNAVTLPEESPFVASNEPEASTFSEEEVSSEESEENDDSDETEEYPDEDSDAEYISDILGEDEVFPDDIVFEEQEYHYEETPDETEITEIADPDNYPISDEFESVRLTDDEVVAEELSDEIAENELEEVSSPEPVEPELSEEESLEIQRAYAEVFSDPGVEEEFQPEAVSYDDDLQGLLFEDLFAQAERIERERNSKSKPEPKVSKKEIPTEPVVEPVVVTVIEEPSVTEISEHFEALQEDTTPAIDEAAETVAEVPQPEVAKETPEAVELQDDKELDELQGKPLDSMNVHQLRRLARSTANFPIQGREISKANRQELLYYFQGIR